MIDGNFANRGIGIAERAVLILLVLKNVWIYCAGANAISARKLVHFADAFNSFGQVPQNVQRYARARSGNSVNLSSVTEFFFDGGSCRKLNEFSEARSSVGEAPG